MVGLCMGLMRSEQSLAFAKDYVFAVGGCNKKVAQKTVERYSTKADMWMTLAELNVARISPSVIVIQDYLYVFGGKTDVGFTTQIERLNLK